MLPIHCTHLVALPQFSEKFRRERPRGGGGGGGQLGGGHGQNWRERRRRPPGVGMAPVFRQCGMNRLQMRFGGFA